MQIVVCNECGCVYDIKDPEDIKCPDCGSQDIRCTELDGCDECTNSDNCSKDLD